MDTLADRRNLLLISNSTVHGRGYLDHAEPDIRESVHDRKTVAFLPYALYDRRAYAEKVQARLAAMGLSIRSVHDVSNAAREIRRADVIFVGGGNTFRLVKALHDYDLMQPIRESAAAGVPYIGSSAGAIVAGPSLKTTKDMPVVEPASFEALSLVDFQISPHYLDPDPSSTHMGETQEERINQFLEENEAAVVGLREGSWLRVQAANVMLRGPHSVRVFRRGHEPVEIESGKDLSALVEPGAALSGRAA